MARRPQARYYATRLGLSYPVDSVLITDFGFTPTDAYCLVSTCPDFRINVYQMCKLGKLNYVAGAELPKRYLGMQRTA